LARERHQAVTSCRPNGALHDTTFAHAHAVSLAGSPEVIGAAAAAAVARAGASAWATGEIGT